MTYFAKNGASTDRVTKFKEFELGSTEIFNGNKVGIYGVAGGTVPVGQVDLNNTGFVITDADGGYYVDAALATGEYGWAYKEHLAESA